MENISSLQTTKNLTSLPNNRFILKSSTSGNVYTLDMDKYTCTCNQSVHKSTLGLNITCKHLQQLEQLNRLGKLPQFAFKN